MDRYPNPKLYMVTGCVGYNQISFILFSRISSELLRARGDNNLR